MRNQPTRSSSPSALFLASALLVGAAAPVPASQQDGVSAAGDQATGESTRGERIPESAFGEVRIVDVMQLHREEARLARDETFVRRMRNGSQGSWMVPSASTLQSAHSGESYITNKWGDTRMGIGFGRVVDLEGAWIAGQTAPSVWARRLRAVGYRDGVEVAASDWFTDIDAEHSWFAIGLEGVDRVVFEADARVAGGAWYGLDDLTYTPAATDVDPRPETTVVDFENLGFKYKLTESGYAGLDWELGTGDFEADVEAVDQPLTLDGRGPQGQLPPSQETSGGTIALGGAGTAPTPGRDFRGARQFDPGAGFIPPDTCGAATMNHLVETVNSNFSVYTKNGTRVVNISQNAFFGTSASPGDARVVYDPHSGRTIVISTDFGTRCFLAVSATDDPTGAYFTTSFVVTAGSDAGHFPDYPTLGVDSEGIYIEFAMFEADVTMTIFVLDKAPLIAGSQSLGAITAFRELPFRGAMQPCVTYGTPGPQYIVHWQNSTNLRLREITGPRNNPTMTNLGSVPVPLFGSPPDVPSSGASVPIDSVDDRLMNAVFRNGSVWTTHAINVSGRAAIRWYQINPITRTTVQIGTIQDNQLGFVMPSLSVNANNDMVIGFSGSSASTFPGAYACGRRSSDPPGQTSPPVQYQPGLNSYESLDGIGRNRWGDYSLTYVDPADDLGFWTFQEYSQNTANRWSTWIQEYTFAGIVDCNNNGVDDRTDVSLGTSQDCNSNGVPDECELAGNDCDSNGVPDECDPDCNSDGTPDGCEPDCDGDGTPDDCETGPDCNGNGTPDNCELTGNDCNGNGIPDDCEVAGNDCNSNGIPDDCELAGNDCDSNGVPDECDPDCDSDGLPDGCESDCDNDGTPDDCETGPDCNGNGIPDNCEPDCDSDGTPDDCEPDCDGDGTPDDCEGSPDCNGNGVPDECELAGNDCNANGIPDDCELGGNDCNSNGVPDECDADCDSDGLPDDCEPDCDGDGTPDDCEPDCDDDGTPDDCEADCDGDGTPDDCEGSPDCNGNGIPDECELAGNDCNSNGIPDECELGGNDCNANGTPDECDPDCDNDGTPDDCEPDCDGDGTPDDCEAEPDCNGNGLPDNCELAGNDCNSNGTLDECDISSGTSDDSDGNNVPDECEFVGSVYCAAAVNSTGDAAELRALGTNVVSANNFQLRSEQLPASVFSLHFFGPNQVQVPFGDGFRCVGGLTQRIQPTDQANGLGVVDRAVDLTLPQVGSIVAGSEWNFQLWFRDPMGPGGNGFNLTNGVNVSFQ